MFNTNNQEYFNIKKTAMITDKTHKRSVFSHCGKMMATCGSSIHSHQSYITIYDITTNNINSSITVRTVIPDDDRFSIVFSPDDTLLLVINANNSVLYDIKGVKMHSFNTSTLFSGDAAVFSKDGSKIVCCDRCPHPLVGNEWINSLKVYDTYTGVLLHTLDSFRTFVMSPQFFSNDTKIISCSADNSQIWDIEKGKVIHSFDNIVSGAVFVAKVSPDDKIIAYCSKGVAFYNTDECTGKCKPYNLFHLTGSFVMEAKFSSDSRFLLTASRDKKIRLYHVQSGICLKILDGRIFDFSADSKSIVIAEKYGISVWCIYVNTDIFTLKRSHTYCFDTITRGPTSISFSSCSNKIISSYSNGTISIFEPDPVAVFAYKTNIKQILTDKVFYGTNLGESIGNMILEYMIGV